MMDVYTCAGESVVKNITKKSCDTGVRDPPWWVAALPRTDV
jgi:hypothetical protein